ncbi:MBL fold metallo-hydrolase [Cohnella soli]|uniref:MBL fold metallo-hydrolase n=1 Tax=Cohnella soli TaxID=425005 RepID=A0ABW0I4T9_9BACL
MHRLHPVMIQLDEGIYMVGSGKHGAQISDPMDCNVYVVDGGNGEYALIDAGGGVNPERIVGNIERAGIDPGQLKLLLLTHGHGDHAAGAAFFHRRYNLCVIASKQVAQWLAAGDLEKFSVPAAIRAGVYPPDYEYPACPVARGVNKNDEIVVGDIVLKVVETPGHARGHISFLIERDGRKLLFGGDSVFAGGKVVIQNTWDSIIPEYADTMAKLHALRIDSLFPGHGTFVLNDAWTYIEKAHGCFERLDVPPNL